MIGNYFWKKLIFKNVYLIIGIAIVLNACTQKNHFLIIEPEISSEHVNVKGTKISIIPPEGWNQANSFNGFQQLGTTKSIMVTELSASFLEMKEGMTRANLMTKGVVLKKKNTIYINGSEGLIIEADQFANGIEYRKYILVFGDEETSFMINGIFPSSLEEEIGKRVRESIFTVVYEPNKEIDPFENIGFVIDVSETNLKFAKMISNMLIYNADGKMPTESDDKVSILVGTSFGKLDIEDKKIFAINRMKQNPPIDIIEPENIKSISIDDISGYEIVGYGVDKDTNEPEMVYQVILFSDNLYYIITGVANDNYENNIKLFKQVSKTFQRK